MKPLIPGAAVKKVVGVGRKRGFEEVLQKSSKRDEVTAVAVEKDSTFWEMGMPEACVCWKRSIPVE